MNTRIALVAFAALTSLALSQPPTPTPPKSSEKAQEASPSKTQIPGQDLNAPAPAASSMPTAHQTQQLAANTGTQQNTEALEDWRIVWFTGILTIVAVLQLIAMGLQSKYMRDGLALTQQSNETSRIAAEAAKQNAIIAERSLTLLNRAYVDTDDWTASVLRHHETNVPSIDIKFAIVNPSHTAFRVDHIDFQWTLLPIGEGSASESHSDGLEFGAMVTPGQRLPFVTPIGKLDEPQTKSYDGLGLGIQFFGRITYTDIFKNTRHRRFARLFFFTSNAETSAVQHSVMLLNPGTNDEEEWSQG